MFYGYKERFSVNMERVIQEPFHAPTRILMKPADSVSGHVKTRNQVLVHPIQPPLPWQQHPKIWAKKEAKNT